MSEETTWMHTARKSCLGSIDRLACVVGIWSLRRLYGADCDTDVRDDFPSEKIDCLGCDAKRLIESMREVLQDG